MERAARELANTVKRRRGDGVVQATVTGTRALYDRSLIECELDDGTPLNAFVFGREEIWTGQEVLLSRTGHGNRMQYAVIAVKGQGSGARDTDRDPDRIQVMYRGDALRPKRIPPIDYSDTSFQRGCRVLFPKTKLVLRLKKADYQEMQVKLRMSDPWNRDNNDVKYLDPKCRWELWAWSGSDPDFTNKPDWRQPILTKSNEFLVEDFELINYVNDDDDTMTAEAQQQAPLLAASRVTLMLAFVRVNSGVFKLRYTGACNKILIRFDRTIIEDYVEIVNDAEDV